MAVFTTGCTMPNLVRYVESIKSDGNQYIKLDVIPTNDTVIKFHNFTPADTTTEPWEVFIGSQTSDNSADTWQFRRYMYDFIGRYQIGATDPSVQANMQKNCEVILGTNSLTINGTVHNFTPTNISSNLPLYLFTCNQNGKPFRNSRFSTGQIEVWQNGVLVYDLYPCYDPDDIVCMYDKLEKKYHYNAGNGKFVAGGIV